MKNSTFAIAAVAAMLAVSPAMAQMTSCTAADMTKMETDAGKMTDATKKADAMKEMAMAKESMDKKDDKGCMTHMDNAMKMMPKM